MEESMDEEQRMMGESVSEPMQIDPKRARFPCSIVWSPLPFISWFIPFIGHIGICREDGVILDFAGPNYVCVDNFTFGAATRYIQINKEKQCRYKQDGTGRDIHSWDEALLKSTQEFQHRNYNLLTCNCHSFVASNLNKLGFQSGGWNVVNVAVHMFVNGRWVNKAAIVKSYVPFVVVFSLGVLVGGWTFLTFLALFTSVLVGWYLVGTYCFKNLIQL